VGKGEMIGKRMWKDTRVVKTQEERRGGGGREEFHLS